MYHNSCAMQLPCASLFRGRINFATLHFLQAVCLFGRNLLYCFGRAVQRNGTLIALQTFILTDLQKKRTVAERETTVHTLPAADAKVVINNVLKIRSFDFPAGKSIDRTELIFRSLVSCEKLRIKKAGTEIAIAAHGVIVETFDRRNQFVTPVRTYAASNTFCRINLPNERIASDFLLTGKKTNGST